ncbi:V-type ATP synthase subunit I [Halalkalicoccus jeotgali]|uniref:A-type ATP synthase subunit I n=1 Tax=Halalkalicoccus jeotgali (strain DSM 18796 / CECT 7217 / JCM 14584 / KCTC 4019 / B3) TaxID=795797 RepID=D8J5W5_HALJB|nr:V-type ATP synthase subunit I [Halalkalicoccus jeotgali]ADJ13771.1 V-type ATPase 116 kDa subunit [Halalkalicoccus jeotgali B3]ELY34183.1 V-type ATPase 116 kDa subunit [Halalkalicoccus jeotgali B3]
MLRPERMSKVSVTGSKRVMDEAIETIHGLNLVHMVDYDDRWAGFRPGDPADEAESISEKLVTVRSIESILDVEEEDGGPSRIVTDEEIDAEIEDVRGRVNELDDRRVALREERREIDDRLSSVRPFAALGIDLDLLSGYDSLETRVVEGNEAAIEEALSSAEGVEEFETFAEEGVVAIFAHPTAGHEDVLEDALVGLEVTPLSVPDAESSPEEYVADLERRKREIDEELSELDGEIEELKLDVAGFLLAVEEQLTIDVEKAEVPLSFATTDRSFIAEGWVPTERYGDLESALEADLGEHVECEELERVDYDDVASGHGHAHGEDPSDAGDGDRQSATAADGEGQSAEVRPDGGRSASESSMHGDEPPVVQDNPGYAKPFESLVSIINRPKYSEFDPTIFLFLTFPAFFGFMIGDVGYGILYMAMGYGLYRGFDSDMLRSLGGIGIWAGIFTFVFGILYGEIFGFHIIADVLWGGSAPIHKGLQPYHGNWALGWLVLSLLIGMLHLAIGWVLDFVENYQSHGFGDALGESGSWLLMLFGVWGWIFAGTPPFGAAPSLLYGSESVFAGNPFPLGFAGFPTVVGFVGLAAFFAGLVLLVRADPVEGVEFLNVLVNVLSYTRIAAVLLAKAGMAFVVNLLVFGVFVVGEGEEAEWHFGTGHAPSYYLEQGTYHGHEVTEVMFGGLFHSGVGGILAGILILVVGHLFVLVLGVTSAGLQAVRLEYVEFFGKFYDGGGESYEPFGHDRSHTTE